MDSLIPITQTPSPETKDTAPLFEDELVLSAPPASDEGSEPVPSPAYTPLTVTGRTQAQARQIQKQGRPSGQSLEDRKRYHIKTVK